MTSADPGLTTEHRLHENYMRAAISVARQNPDARFGSVLVDRRTGKVVASGVNASVTNPTHHGEMVAINDYVRRRGVDWAHLTLYSTTPRIVAPPLTPLVFWGLFGVGVIWIVSRSSSGETASRIKDIQSWILGTVITLGSVGSAYLVIVRTKDITRGHAILLIILSVSADRG